MPWPSTERRLRAVGKRLRRAREELAIVDEQLLHLAGDADDATIHALVAESALAEREQVEARRHADAMRARRAELAAAIAGLERDQDALLDRLGPGGRAREAG